MIVRNLSSSNNCSLASVFSTPSFRIGDNSGRSGGILPTSLLIRICTCANDNSRCFLMSTLKCPTKSLISSALRSTTVAESLMTKTFDSSKLFSKSTLTDRFLKIPISFQSQACMCLVRQELLTIILTTLKTYLSTRRLKLSECTTTLK